MQIKQQTHNLPAVVCRRVAEEGHPEGKSELGTLGKCRDKEKIHAAKQSLNGGNLERKESPASESEEKNPQLVRRSQEP